MKIKMHTIQKKRQPAKILWMALTTLTIMFSLVVIAPSVKADTTVVGAQPGTSAGGCSNGEQALAGESKVCCPTGYSNTALNCFVGKYVNPSITVLSLIAGIAVVGGIIWGGIQYSMSGGDPQLVTKGKSTITKSLVGLVSFLLLATFINFLSPSGVKTDLTASTSSGNSTTASCVSNGSKFLGMKPWYAYVPDGSFYSDCTLKESVAIFPSGSEKGVLPQVILAVVDDLLRVAALVAVAFTIVGGVKYMTSQGEPAQTKQALGSIINALIGLAIAIVAAAVVSFIGSKLSS